MEYIKSNDFFGGYYADKVMEIHSDQKKTEKDENIQKLLSLEAPDNKIEIVIHVNMLKEGWDVTNLYTIIPLRTSASETLTEQTIGRGLRLPYGERTGVDEVDRLSIVSHDKYAAIVNLANDPNSLVRKVYYIDPSDDTHGSEQRETIEMPTAYETATTDSNVTEQLALVFQEETRKTTGEEAAKERAEEVARFVAGYASKSVIELNKQVKTFDAVHDEETQAYVKQSVIAETIKQFPDMDIAPEVLEVIVEKAVAACVQALIGLVIPIPKAVVQPYTKVNKYFQSFTLNTSSMNWYASDDTLIGTELQEDGKTFEMNSEHYARKKVDTAENEIVRHIIVHDNVDYMSCADLLYSLVNDAKQHFLTYLSEEDTERVMRDRQKTIADIIYAQMQEHFYHEETDYKSSKIRPFTKIITGFGGKYKSDEIYDLRANIPLSEIPKKIFGGFTKACHTLYKFDSGTERDFAIVLERDTDILKWLRPAPEQFDIRYGTGYRDKYEPDFIVETADTIYMVETKASKDLTSESVMKKAKAAKTYCDAVTEWNKDNNGKPWEYVLLSHEEVRINSSFMYLVKNSVRYEQMILDL